MSRTRRNVVKLFPRHFGGNLQSWILATPKNTRSSLIKQTVHISCCSLTLILLAWSVCGSQKSRNRAHPNLALLLCCSRTLLKSLREKVNELEVAGSWRPWGHFCFHQFVTLMNSHDRLLPDSWYWTAECKEGSREGKVMKKSNSKWMDTKNSDYLLDFSPQLPTNLCSHNNHLTDSNTLWNKLVKKWQGSVRFKHLNHGVNLGRNEGFAEHLFFLSLIDFVCV